MEGPTGETKRMEGQKGDKNIKGQKVKTYWDIGMEGRKGDMRINGKGQRGDTICIKLA